MNSLSINRAAENRAETGHEVGADYDRLEPAVDSSSDSDNNQEKDENEVFEVEYQDPVVKYMMRMVNLTREIALFCIVVMAYAALTKDAPKISRAPAAYPFFSKDSYVIDLYNGQISRATEYSRTSDVAFVMFYAPWDAESQNARSEFEIAADYMQKYVSFVAINCWQPTGECRAQYSKVYKWPVLIAYPAHGKGVRYNGPISAPHMIRFLNNLCKPLKRWQDKDWAYEDAYIVAELNTLPGSAEFGVFYTAALRYLEQDPFSQVTFYVKPRETSELALSLYLWDEKRVSPIFEVKDWTAENILQWLFQHLHQSTHWVSPSSSKSLILSTHISSNATLILFTPRNPLLDSTDLYSMLQEVAQDYNNCENVMPKFDILDKRLRNRLKYNHFENICKPKHVPVETKIISCLNSKAWANSSSCAAKNKKDCEILEKRSNNLCEEQHRPKNNFGFVQILPEEEEQEHICDKTKDGKFKTSMLGDEKDPKSMINLKKHTEREMCRQFLSAQKIQPAVFENSRYAKNEPALTGLACKTNQTLNFIAMDSLLYYHFAERLGVDILKAKDKSAVVILNDQSESHYVLEGVIDSKSLRGFIRNFTQSSLPRSLKSSSLVKSKTAHSYSHKFESLKNNSVISVTELTSASFLTTVLKKNKAAIVMYYSKHCSFCNGISYTFLMVAKKLSFVENLIFSRIDGDLNLLPWEYTMEKYPTFLFFPANSKSESRVFPSNMFITVPNLVGFILSNLDPYLRLQAMYALCNQSQFKGEKVSCFSSLRAETLALIESTLRDWRKSNKRQRQIILHRLKQFKNLHFLLGHSPENTKLVQSNFRRFSILETEDYKFKHVDIKDEL